jgi:uncharacterized protein (TIGR03382 family)
MGPGYYFGWWGQQGFTYANPLPLPYSGFMDGQTAIGEFNAGAALGLGLAKVLLPGKPTGLPPTVTLCTDRVCGDDGCGGACGACGSGESCTDAGMCTAGTAPPDGGSTPLDAGTGGAMDSGNETSPLPPNPPAGCGCAAAAPAEAVWGLVFGLALLRRRRHP